MIRSADKLSEEAEKKSKLNLLSKANALRKGAREKEEEISLINQKLDEKLSELKAK